MQAGQPIADHPTPQQQWTQSAHISGNRETEELSSYTAQHQDGRQGPTLALAVPAGCLQTSMQWQKVTQGISLHLPNDIQQPRETPLPTQVSHVVNQWELKQSQKHKVDQNNIARTQKTKLSLK